MFDRKKYKHFAKVQLKGRWGIPIIITIISLVVSILFVVPNFVKLFQSEDFWYFMNTNDLSLEEMTDFATRVSSSTPYLVSVIQGIVAAILEVAAINVYIKMTMSPEPVTFSAFLEGLNNWGRATLAHLWRALWTFLWMTLTVPLLSIPGIIKSLSYSQMLFIISENKEVPIPKALKISMLITRGHKGEIFIMYLSFIGWLLLAGLTMGVGTIFLEPYMKLTFLNAYHSMLQEAIESGKLRLEDLSE